MESMIRIDKNICVGCGLCVSDCPGWVLELKDKKAAFKGPADHCLQCHHCVAICKAGAVGAPGPAWGPVFKAVKDEGTYIRPGAYDETKLLSLMRSRRSCRAYNDEPVSREALEDLINAGTTAPSGTNSQMWTFTVLPDRASVELFAEKVAGFYRRLNANAEKRHMRLISRLFMKDVLSIYRERYAEKVTIALDEWEKNRKDYLFFGAPSAIVIAQKPDASCPAEDSLLAAAHMGLTAHALGLGTCLIGFAVEAMKRDPSIQQRLGIPADETVYAVMIVGKPARKYRRVTGRKRVRPRWFSGENAAGR